MGKCSRGICRCWYRLVHRSSSLRAGSFVAMPAAFYDDNGNHVKQCSKCKEVLPVENYYQTPEGFRDGFQSRCRPCILATHKEQNRRRNKKRKQRTHKLNKIHVDWIREQKGILSTRETAKAFSKRFFAYKISQSTVQRIFAGKIHVQPGEDNDTISIYDLLEGASDMSGSVEDYLDTVDPKKVKY